MENNIITQVEGTYGFSIKSYVPAPRGWWAETYILDTDKDKYFIKIFKENLPFEVSLRTSLDIQFQMAEQIKYIPKPIRTRNGTILHTLDNKRVIALYTCINGTKYSAKSACEILNLMVNVYKLDIRCDSIYYFEFYSEKIIKDLKINKYSTKSKTLTGYMNRNRDFFIKYWNLYEDLVYRVRNKKNKLYLTHGDIGVNLMVDDNEQVFIVDWDSIHLGPIERDLREYIDFSTDIKQLEAIAKNAGLYWEFDKDYHNYFILNGIYDDLGHFFYEIDTELPNSEIEMAEKITGQQQYIDDIEKKLIL